MRVHYFWSVNRGRQFWISWAVLPLIKTRFCLAPFPAKIWTSCRKTPKCCARNWHNSALAWPSTGGAARRTLRDSPCNPTISVLDARGWQWIRSSTFPDRSFIQELIWFKPPPPYHLKRCFISLIRKSQNIGEGIIYDSIVCTIKHLFSNTCINTSQSWQGKVFIVKLIKVENYYHYRIKQTNTNQSCTFASVKALRNLMSRS